MAFLWGQPQQIYQIYEKQIRVVALKSLWVLRSNCSYRQKMPLSVRIYDCPNCGIKLDRDFNASLNLENYQALAVGLTTLGFADGGGHDF